MADKVQRLPEVIEDSGRCRSSIYAGIAAGTFPKPIKLGPRAIGWLRSDIQNWLSERVQDRDDKLA